MYVGYDFGNGTRKIAGVDANGKAFPIGSHSDGFAIPNALFHGPSGWVFGEEAVRQSFLSADDYVENYKPRIADEEPLCHGLNAVELASLAIQDGKQLAESRIGETIDGCVATIPATFNDRQKRCIKLAFERAGITVLKIISEPAAALLAYINEFQPNERDGHFVVYDIGDSTFDVVVATVVGGEVQVQSIDGEAEVGGNKIRQCVQEIALTKLTEQIGDEAARHCSEALFMRDMVRACTSAKIALGQVDEYQMPLAAGGNRVIVTITRTEFEQALQPLVDQTLACTERALKAAGVTPDQCTFVLVGGPSRSPFIQNRVAEHFHVTPRTNVDPQLVVSFGAALAAQTELRARGRVDTIGGRAVPSPRTTLRQVTTHALGVSVAEIQPDGSKRLLNAVIVPKDVPVPCEKTELFRLESPDQREALIEILQGKPNAFREECLVIGEGRLPDLPAEPARSPRISVTVKHDSSALATITVRDLLGGGEVTFSVNVPNQASSKR